MERRLGKNKAFIVGMITSMVLLIGGTFTWAATLVIKVQPAIRAIDKSKLANKYSRQERADLVVSLEKLYHLSKFLGLREYASLAMGSAGAILSLDNNRTSLFKAKYFYLKAIEEAEHVAQHPPSKLAKSLDPLDPLLEAYFHYSMFLHDHGEKIEAKNTLRRAKKMAESMGSKSHWIKNINTTIHAMNSGTI